MRHWAWLPSFLAVLVLCFGISAEPSKPGKLLREVANPLIEAREPFRGMSPQLLFGPSSVYILYS